MKNLKRILSLALASVMVMGMMVVGASAAFNDQADINANNVDAVNTMVALKIISGKENNTFDPEGPVNRAEMATMIAMALNGGNKDFRGTTTTGFTDVDNDVSMKWAAKFIKYCVDQGILSGVGGGKFNPKAQVTAQEAATMVLTAMGYKKEMLKSETSDWAAKVNLKAEQRRLYDDTSVTDYTQTIDRQTAAQMVFNGITIKTPQIRDTYNTTTGEHEYSVSDEDGEDSILKSAFNADMKYAVMQTIAYNSNNKQYTYTLSGALAGGDADSRLPADDKNLNSTEDHADLFLKRVRVLYDTNKNIIAITEIGDSVLSYGAIGDLEFNTAKDKLDGKEFATGIKMWNFGVDATTASNGTTLAQNSDIATAMGDNSVCSKYEIVDYNIDGKADAVILYPTTVATVSYIGKDYVNAGANRSEKQYDYADLARNDVVLVTEPVAAANRKGTLEKLELTEMTFDGINKDGEFRSAGQWYTDASGVSPAIDLGANKTWKTAVVNGYIVARQAVETAAEVGDVVLIAAADTAVTDAKPFKGTPKYLAIRVMDLDGNYTELDVTKVDNAEVSTTNAAVHKLVTYAEDPNNEGFYTLTSFATPSGSYKKDAAGSGKEIKVTGKKITGGQGDSANYNIMAEGKFFVSVTVDGVETLKVVTGADIAKWDGKYWTAGANTEKSVVYATTVNGFKTANLGLLVLDKQDLDGDDDDTDMVDVTAFPGAVSNKVLAWTTSDAIFTQNAKGIKYLEIKVWDGEAERTIHVTSIGSTPVANDSVTNSWKKGKPVTFLENGNGFATALTLVSGGSSTYVNAWDGVKNIQIAGTDAVIDDTWTVLYVDTAENQGVEGGNIQIARKDALNNYVNNVYADTSEKLLVVDTSNQVAGLAGVGKITVETAGTYITDVDTTNRELTVAATGATRAQLVGEIQTGNTGNGLRNVKSYKVFNGTAEIKEDTINMVNGYIVRVAAYDGTVVDLTIKGITASVNAAAAVLADSCAATQNVTLAAGKATLTVTATSPDGGSLSYAWTKDGDAVAGATGASLKVTEAATYVCTITNTNNAVNGTKTNNTITVTFTVTAG